MTDPTRLLDDASPLARELLAAGTHEEPSPEAMQRALAAVAAAGVAAAGAGVALGVAHGAAAEGGSALGLGLVAKWVGIGAVASAAVLGAAHGVGVWPEPATASAPTSPAAAPRTVHAPPGGPVGVGLPAPAAVAAPPATTLVTAPVIGAAEPRVAGRQEGDAVTPAAAPPASALAAEVAALDRARAAVARGDAVSALGELGRYQERFGQGALGPEAALLRMEALLAAGRTAEARSIAQQLLARQPTGPHAARARAVLGTTP